MITSFKHAELERFYTTGESSTIPAFHLKCLRVILANLDQAQSPQDMDLPALRLKEPKAGDEDTWSVSVTRNWRLTFRFTGENAEMVHYEDITT